MGVNRRVLHYDYIYLTTLEDPNAFDTIDSILDYIEQQCGQELFDIQSTYDDVAKLWTLRFASASIDLPSEYTFKTSQ